MENEIPDFIISTLKKISKKFIAWSIKNFGEGNKWKRYIFIYYCVCILFFAKLYHWQFTRNPESFIINSEILRNKENEFKMEKARVVNSLKKCKMVGYEFLREINSGLKPFRNLPDGSDNYILENNKHQIDIRSIHLISENDTLSGSNNSYYYVDFYDLNTPSVSLLPSNYKKSFRIKFEKIPESDIALKSSIVKAKLIMINNEINILKKSNLLKFETLDYWDFLYFSVVTQNTIGYGDIFPGLTLTRILVLLQSIVSVFFITVLFSLSFTKD